MRSGIYNNQINLVKWIIKVKWMNPAERINPFPTIFPPYEKQIAQVEIVFIK